MAKKSTKAVAAVCTAALCVTGVFPAMAADEPDITWRSQGRIEFNNNTAESDDDVIFDADDFKSIADNVMTGKNNVKNTLLNYPGMEKWCNDKGIDISEDVASFDDLNRMAQLLGNMKDMGDVIVDGDDYETAMKKNPDEPVTKLKDAHYSSVTVDYNDIVDKYVKNATGEKNDIGEVDVTGSASKSDVLIGRTFMSGQYGSVAQEGTMPEVTYDSTSGYTLRDSNGTKTQGVVELQDVTIEDGKVKGNLSITKGYYNVDNTGKIEASISTESKTVTPGTSAQTIKPSAGKVLSQVTIKGDANLKAANIVKGKSIFGVAGTHTCATIESLIGTNATLDNEGKLMAGVTAYGKNGVKYTGSMKDRGAVSATLNTSTTSYTVPEGYHNGQGKVSISTQTKTASNPGTSNQTVTPDNGKVLSSVTVPGDADLIAENIKEGVNIFGVTGSLNSSFPEEIDKVAYGTVTAPGKNTHTVIEFGFIPDLVYTFSYDNSGNPIAFIYNAEWNTGKSINMQLNEASSGRSFPLTSNTTSGNPGIYPNNGESTIGTSAILKCRESNTMGLGTTDWIAVKFK